MFACTKRGEGDSDTFPCDCEDTCLRDGGPVHEPQALTFHAYEEAALSSAVYPQFESEGRGVLWERLPIYPALGLAGEVGEFVEKVKKAARGDAPLDRTGAAAELGDVLWYLTACAHDIGYTLEEVARMNNAKTLSRKARGVVRGSGDAR